MQTKIRNAVVYLLMLSAFSLAAQQLIRYGYLFGMRPDSPSLELNVNFMPRLRPDDGKLDKPSIDSWVQGLLYQAGKTDDRKRIQALLDKGWNLKGPHGVAALSGAIDANRADTVIYLINKGADINGRNFPVSVTPLGWAMYRDRFQMFKFLLSKGANSQVGIFNQGTLLSYAASNGLNRYVQVLLQQGGSASAPIASAATAPKPVAAAHAADARNVDAPVVNGRTALMDACLAGERDTIKQLLDAGANVNATADDGSTPLMNAALGKHLGAVRLLVERGADINAATTNYSTFYATFTTYKGWTPIIFAIQKEPNWVAEKRKYHQPQSDVYPTSDPSDIVMFLLSKGADINAGTAKGKTALSHAIDMERPDLVKLLVAHGADVNAVDWENSVSSPNGPLLSLAASKGQGDIVNDLIEHGAKDVNSAFISAVLMEHFDIANALLKNGADVNATEKYNSQGKLLDEDEVRRTALMLAVQYNKPNEVRFLLAHGADPAIKTFEGLTAADYAKSYTSQEIATMLDASRTRQSAGITKPPQQASQVTSP